MMLLSIPIKPITNHIDPLFAWAPGLSFTVLKIKFNIFMFDVLLEWSKSDTTVPVREAWMMDPH